jgi:RNA polymerase sigma-70 factor (ECF subfamily)
MPVSNQDNPIVERIRQGDMQAYALLVDRYKDKVFSLVLGIVRSRELAEEVAQDVFVKAFRSLSSFREEASFSTWLYRIAYNSSVSETRKRKINHVALEEDYHQAYGLSQDDHEEEEERHRHLGEAISSLNPEEQLLVQLYYREEKSVEDVSLCLNNTISNVKVKLFRLRNKLRMLMEELNKSACVL